MTKTKKLNIKDLIDGDSLDLSLSNLTDVPVKELMVYKRVTTLDMSNNRIVKLHPDFGMLDQLTKLDLSNNRLKTLSGSIGKLTQLRHLDLYGNEIEHLPLELGLLRNLRYIDLKGNPLTPVLAKVVGPCLTLADCQKAAKNLVKFLAEMYERRKVEDARKAREKREETEAREKEEAAARLEATRIADIEQARLKKERKALERERREQDRLNEELKRTVASGGNNRHESNGGTAANCQETNNYLFVFKVLFTGAFIWMILFVSVIIAVWANKDYYVNFVMVNLPSDRHQIPLFMINTAHKVVNRFIEYYQAIVG